MLQTLKITFLSLTLLTASYVAFAGQDFTEIELEYTYVEYLSFIGSAVGSSHYLNYDDIVPDPNKGRPTDRIGQTVGLGTLGLGSNIFGTCTLDFSSVNDFQLLHTTSGQLLSAYKIGYRDTEITTATNLQMQMPCQTEASDISFTSTGNFKKKLKAGIYQDIIRISVTSQ